MVRVPGYLVVLVLAFMFVSSCSSCACRRRHVASYGDAVLVAASGSNDAAVADAAVLLALQTSQVAAAPKPSPGPDDGDDSCDNCNGTGKTGDGRIVMVCRVCDGTGKKSSREIAPEIVPEIAAPEEAVPPSQIATDATVMQLLDGLVGSKPLPESCPMPEPVDYDRIVAAVLAKLAAETPPESSEDMRTELVETVKAQLRAELSASWTKMSNTMRELLTRVEALEAVKPVAVPEITTSDVPLPPASAPYVNTTRFTVPSEPVVITVYAPYGSPEYLYARDVLLPSLPAGWQLSYVYAKTGQPFQALYNRQVYRWYSRPSVGDILATISK